MGDFFRFPEQGKNDAPDYPDYPDSEDSPNWLLHIRNAEQWVFLCLTDCKNRTDNVPVSYLHKFEDESPQTIFEYAVI